MKTTDKKAVVIRVSPRMKQELKVFTAKNNTTIQEYILDLINKDAKLKTRE